jgi:hypothetical protein
LKGQEKPKNSDEQMSQELNPEPSQNPIWRIPNLNLEPATQPEQHLQSCGCQQPWKNVLVI